MIVTEFVQESGLKTDPSFYPLHTSSPIPLRPSWSGPGGRRPPGMWQIWCPPSVTAVIRCGWNQAESTGGLTLAKTAWATSISPRTNVALYPTSHNPVQWPKGWNHWHVLRAPNHVTSHDVQQKSLSWGRCKMVLITKSINTSCCKPQ